MAVKVATATARVASKTANYQEDPARALKRQCAAMFGLSLAEFSRVDTNNHLPANHSHRLGSLKNRNGTSTASGTL